MISWPNRFSTAGQGYDQLTKYSTFYSSYNLFGFLFFFFFNICHFGIFCKVGKVEFLLHDESMESFLLFKCFVSIFSQLQLVIFSISSVAGAPKHWTSLQSSVCLTSLYKWFQNPSFQQKPVLLKGKLLYNALWLFSAQSILHAMLSHAMLYMFADCSLNSGICFIAFLDEEFCEAIFRSWLGLMTLCRFIYVCIWHILLVFVADEQLWHL